MSSFISPYRFNSGDSGDQLGWAVFLSAAVHLLAAGLIIYVLPALLTNKVGPPEIIEEPWIVHIPGDIRTNAYDEPQIDPRQASRDEGQVTKNTDQSKPPPSVREEPVIPVEDFVVPLGKVIDNPTQKSEELVRATVLPEISTPDVQPEPASAIIRGEDVGGGGGKGASEGTQELHPEIAGYYGLIRSIISRNWTTPNETFSLDINGCICGDY